MTTSSSTSSEVEAAETAAEEEKHFFLIIIINYNYSLIKSIFSCCFCLRLKFFFVFQFFKR
jgi:hypothetical protein